jgi:hypothetical protein
MFKRAIDGRSLKSINTRMNVPGLILSQRFPVALGFHFANEERRTAEVQA